MSFSLFNHTNHLALWVSIIFLSVFFTKLKKIVTLKGIYIPHEEYIIRSREMIKFKSIQAPAFIEGCFRTDCL